MVGKLKGFCLLKFNLFWQANWMQILLNTLVE